MPCQHAPLVRCLHAMKIGIIHEISDPESFTERGTDMVASTPEGIKNLQACPAEDLSTCTCIWEATSVEELSEFVDTSLGDASTQTYFSILEEQAIGLP